MSTRGLFALICNHGIQDRILMASSLLNERLKAGIHFHHNDETDDEAYEPNIINNKRGRDEDDESKESQEVPTTPDHMFIPLLFWYCQDPTLSLPLVAIPYGERKINIDLNFEVPVDTTPMKKRRVLDEEDTDEYINAEGKMMRDHADDNEAPMKRRMISV